VTRTSAPIRLVIADDAPEARKLLRAMLDRVEGVELLGAATDGVEALELVDRLRPDLALLDIAMPRMDGLEAAGAIRARWPEVKLIVCSAYSRDRMEAAALAAGADIYLEKSSTLDPMLEAIGRLFPDRDAPTRRVASAAPPPPTWGAAGENAAEQRYRLLLDALDETVLVLDRAEAVVAANFAAARTLGIPTSQLIGRRLSECGFEKDPETDASLLDLVRARQPASQLPVRHRGPDQYRYMLASVRPLGRTPDDDTGRDDDRETLVSLVDLTAQRAAQDALRENEELFRSALDLMPDPALILAPVQDGAVVRDFRVVFANRAARDVVAHYGSAVHEALWSALPQALRREEDLPAFTTVVQTGHPYAAYALLPEPSDAGWGRRGYDMHLARIGDGVLVTYYDMASRRQAADGERRIERLRSVLLAADKAARNARDARELLQAACDIAVEHGGFRMAWVGLLDADSAVQPAAAAGVGQDYIAHLAIRVRDGARSLGPTATAVRTARHVAMNDIERDPRMTPWRTEALSHGFHSSAAFPLHRGPECIGALTVYAAERGYFGDTEMVMLDQLATEISLGLTALAGWLLPGGAGAHATPTP
jgi:CheY-like chemotaxis protein